MAIYRLSIEVLQGSRFADDDESGAIALKELDALEARIRTIPDVVLHPEDEEAPWGVEVRPDTLNLDFDQSSLAEALADEMALDLIKEFLMDGR